MARGDFVNTTQCKRCGDTDVYWETSSRTGKKYLARAYHAYGGPVATKFAHTEADCRAYVSSVNNLVIEPQRGAEVFKRRKENPEKSWDEIRAEVEKDIPLRTVQDSSANSEKPKGFSNKFAGKCVGCGNQVDVHEGLTSKNDSGKWEVRCVGCHHG